MKTINIDVAIWSWREWLAIIKSLFMFNTRKGKNIYKLQLELENLYPDSKVVILNSARAGIIIALKVFQQKKPQCKEVIIPKGL